MIGFVPKLLDLMSLRGVKRRSNLIKKEVNQFFSMRLPRSARNDNIVGLIYQAPVFERKKEE